MRHGGLGVVAQSLMLCLGTFSMLAMLSVGCLGSAYLIEVGVRLGIESKMHLTNRPQIRHIVPDRAEES